MFGDGKTVVMQSDGKGFRVVMKDLVENKVLVILQPESPRGVDHEGLRQLIHNLKYFLEKCPPPPPSSSSRQQQQHHHLYLLEVNHDTAARAAWDVAHLSKTLQKHSDGTNMIQIASTRNKHTQHHRTRPPGRILATRSYHICLHRCLHLVHAGEDRDFEVDTRDGEDGKEGPRTVIPERRLGFAGVWGRDLENWIGRLVRWEADLKADLKGELTRQHSPHE